MPLAIIVLTLAAGTALFAGWDTLVGSRAAQRTDDAYLQADMSPLSARVAGNVRRVAVSDFQAVQPGDLLVEIVDDDYRARVAQAEANVAAGEGSVANIESQRKAQEATIRAAGANVAAAEAAAQRDRLEAARQRALLSSGITGTRQRVEQTDAADRSSAAAVEQVRAQLDVQRQQAVVLGTQITQQRSSVEASRAALELARIDLARTRIVAPFAGVVGRRQVQDGQYVAVGAQVAQVVPLPNLYVIANYKETQLTRVRIGQAATVTVDAYPGVALRGKVDSLSPGSGAVFALLPADNATGNFTKVVQRVPVRITLDPLAPDTAALLRPGLSVVATIQTQ